jgi:hypothetical protein
MTSVVIRCPATGKLLDTGFVMSRLAFEMSDLRGGTVLCPHCCETHVWRKQEAFLEPHRRVATSVPIAVSGVM